MTLQHPLSIVIFCISLLTIIPASAADPEKRDQTAQWMLSTGSFTGLPAGSLVSIAVALERGIQAIKLDLVLSGDNQVMILGDPRLNDLTNVDRIYPERAREDGSYYSVDFTRDELSTLTHRRKAPPASPPGQATIFIPEFPVISLEEALGYIELTRTDQASRPIIIGELRKGWLHRREQKDLARSAFVLLEDYYHRSGKASLHLASYDPEELQQLSDKMDPAGESGIELIQLIGTNNGEEAKTLDFGHYQPYNYDLLFTKFGLKASSTYAAAIGLTPQAIFSDTGEVLHASYLDDAQTLGMGLILYGEPGNILAGSLPDPSPSTLLDYLYTTLGFDALLTDDEALVSSWNEGTGKNTSGNAQDNTIERLIRQIENNPPEQPTGQTEQPPSRKSGIDW